jgi:hypothetical protein
MFGADGAVQFLPSLIRRNMVSNYNKCCVSSSDMEGKQEYPVPMGQYFQLISERIDKLVYLRLFFLVRRGIVSLHMCSVVLKTLAGGDVPGILGADRAVYQSSGFPPEFFSILLIQPCLLAQSPEYLGLS